MAKADKFYFDNLVEAAEVSHKAAVYLVYCLKNYNKDEIKTMLEKMHEYEHEGDTKKHFMTEALAKAFVTPVDREDLEMISHNLDEVTDGIEEVLQRFYVDSVETVPAVSIEFAEKLVECCTLMKDMLTEFINFKKPQKLHEKIIALNNLEEVCDKLYLQATKDARKDFSDVLDVICWREIYDKMECVADACEHVGDSVSMVVMKNN